MRRFRRLRWALPPAIAAAGLVITAVSALAASPNLVDARLQGAWNIAVTITGYTGPTPQFQRPIGQPVTDTIWFQPACQAPGNCVVRVWGPSGPNEAQASYYQFFSQKSGFQGPSATQGLQQSGASYSSAIVLGGFGGRLQCPPPSGGTRPAQQISLQVTDARLSGGDWLATAIEGTEILNAGWGCNGSQTLGWTTETLAFTGHPVGYVALGPAADRTSVLTVSSIAAALNPPGQAFKSPALLAANLVITAIVILFITFPSALFNHTLSDNYEEITAVTRRFGRLRPNLPAGPRRDAVTFAAVLLAGAWINGQLDSQFGFNGSSVVSFAATVVNICFGVAFSTMVAVAYRRARHKSTAWHFRALPFGLVFAALCVVVSRLTGFQPGYFYGLVVGIAFGTSLARHEAGHTAALASLASMGLAVVAWFGWAAVNPSAAKAGAGWPLVLLDDFLGSLFVGGLVGNVVGLLPLRSLQGGTLVNWRRPVWAVIFGIAVFGMVQVLLHPENGKVHPSSAPLVTAVLLFVGFAGGSLAFNRYFTWEGRPTRLRRPEPEPVPAPARTG